MYTPLSDHDIAEEARGPAFAKWVSSYFDHGDLNSRDFSQLKQREAGTSKKPTTDTISLEELSTITDLVPGVKCDTFIIISPTFSTVLAAQTTKALFDPQIRKDWGGNPVSFVYGEASTWNIQYAAWNLEKHVEASAINFKAIPGANHFVCYSLCIDFYSSRSEQITFIIVNVG